MMESKKTTQEESYSSIPQGTESHIEDTILYKTLNEISPDVSFDVYKFCIEKNVKARHIKYMKAIDVTSLIPEDKLGMRIEFLQKLQEWNEKSLISNCACGSITQTEVRAISSASTKSVTSSIFNDITSTSSVDFTKTPKQPSLSKQYVLCEMIPDFETIKTSAKTDLLTECSRNSISRAIIDHFEKKNQLSLLRPGVLSDIAQQIEENFPGESEQAWYFKEKGKKASGKLYNRLYNIKRKLYEPLENQDENLITCVTKEKTKSDMEAEEIKTWLKYNLGKKDSIIHKWKLTTLYRKKDFMKYIEDSNISNILNQWPAFKLPEGYKLINIDFEQSYPEAEKKFYLNWESFENYIPLKYKSEFEKNTAVLENLEFVMTKIREKEKSIKQSYLIYLLHYVLKPTVTKSSKLTKQASVDDSLNSFFKFIDSPSDTDDIVKKQIQPCILCLGKDILNSSKYYSYIDNIVYEFNSFIKAFNTLFKSFHVFNIQYPKECENVWIFIQTFLFEINLERDKKNLNNVEQLKRFLHSEKSKSKTN